MTKTVALLAVFLMVLGTFVFVAPKASAQGAAPVWSIGDYWEYTGSGDIMGSEYNMLLRYDVNERTTISVGSTSYDAFYVKLKNSMTAGSVSSSVTYDYWVRASDLADIKLEMEYLTLQINITYDPPHHVFDFPLSNGDIWSSTSTVTIAGMGMPPSSSTIATYYVVSGPEKITVPAGTFDSFSVTGTSSGGDSLSSFYSDTVGYNVKTSSFSLLGLTSSNMSAMELKTYNYQHASGLVWIVLIVVIVIVVVVASVTALVVKSYKKRQMAPPMPPQTPPFPPQS